jgi:hypothetical protein
MAAMRGAHPIIVIPPISVIPSPKASAVLQREVCRNQGSGLGYRTAGKEAPGEVCHAAEARNWIPFPLNYLRE